jgi:hypothetical protein
LYGEGEAEKRAAILLGCSEQSFVSNKRGRQQIIDAMDDPCTGLPFFLLAHLFSIFYIT